MTEYMSSETHPNIAFYKHADTVRSYPSMTPVDTILEVGGKSVILEMLIDFETYSGFKDTSYLHDEYSGWWLVCDAETYNGIRDVYERGTDFFLLAVSGVQINDPRWNNYGESRYTMWERFKKKVGL